MVDPARSLIVVGGSAGGVEAMRRFVGALPADLDAAVLMVLHLSPTAPSVLPDILERAGPLPVVRAVDGVPLVAGQIIVAVPDRHLRIEDATVCESSGPKENGHRPAIDVLFRTAAEHFGSSVVGILLSGLLDDGVAGLRMILDAGGTSAVQDPAEAVYGAMPRSAIESGVAGRVLSAEELAAFAANEVKSIAVNGRRQRAKTDAPPDAGDPLRPGDPAGDVSALTCPSCGGALWQTGTGGATRFTCRMGHSFSGDAMAEGQANAVDDALWGAYRSLLEQADLHRRLARRYSGRDTVRRHEFAADEAVRRAQVLRTVVLDELA